MAEQPTTLLEFEATFVADPADAAKLEGAITGIFTKARLWVPALLAGTCVRQAEPLPPCAGLCPAIASAAEAILGAPEGRMAA